MGKKVNLCSAGIVVLVAVSCLPVLNLGAEGISTVKFGAVYPLTGPLGTIGVRSKAAVELAVDIINGEVDLDLPFARTQGIPSMGGARLEPVIADSQSDPATGMAEAERLISRENVVVLMGCFQSSVTKTVSFAAERMSTPFINADSISPALAERGFKWYFQTTPDANVFAWDWFRFLTTLQEEKGIRTDNLTIGLLYENTDAGVNSAVAWEAASADFNYDDNIVVKIPYPHGASDVTSEVLELMRADPDIVFQVSYTPDAILLLRTSKELGFAPKAIMAWDSGHSDPAFLKAVGSDADGIFVGEMWSERLAALKPTVAVVNQMYKERCGQEMDASAARAFTAVFVIADALERAASTEKAAIREALRETDIPGEALIVSWGGITFDPETGRNLLANTLITQIRNGEYRVVWPFDLAEAEPAWPFVPWSER